jgi:serine/threonine-protein kinase
MKKIGGYEIIEKIGKGGMGTVYKGRQVSLDRPIAVKVMSKKLTDRDDLLARFKRESIIIARLNHPNIIHVIDRGITHQGMPYFVMEFVEGTDLATAAQKGNLDADRKLDVIVQVCKALSYAHKNRVIHRDIKPSNVLIDADGNAVVLDFGIAKLFAEDGHETGRTQSNVVMGTLEYMSPEQRRGANHVNCASDLYSLGALMYELFTGVKALGHFRAPSELDRTITAPLEKVILRCLEPDPENRFASADEIRDHLLKLLQGAHLSGAQKEGASQVLSEVRDKFSLLDLIKKEDRYGAVYLYQDKVNHRLLVIKKRKNTAMGLSEAKLLSTLKHKNIINILGTSGSEKVFIIVMEYLSGGSLNDRLVQPLPWTAALGPAREICEGLSFAHKNRVIHGNLRPSNILFTESGQVKITDFGLEEHYAAGQGGRNWYNVFNEPRSPNADIFAAGTIFYQMLTGSLPVWKVGHLAPNDPFKSIPIKFQEMISRMLEPEQADHYRSFDEVIVSIDGLVAAHRKKPRRTKAAAKAPVTVKRHGSKWPAWLLVSLVVLLIATVAYMTHTGDIKTYTDAILALWDKLTLQLGSLFRK